MQDLTPRFSRDARWPSELFFDDILQDPVIQGQVGIHLLEAAILCLQRLEPAQIRSLKAAVLRPPLVERGAADAKLPADILHRNTLFGSLQGADDLFFAVLALAHDDLLVRTAIMPKFQLSVVRF